MTVFWKSEVSVDIRCIVLLSSRFAGLTSVRFLRICTVAPGARLDESNACRASSMARFVRKGLRRWLYLKTPKCNSS